MARLSIIIPLTGNARAFEDTLASVLRHQPASSEIIVVHDGKYKDPHDVEFEGVKFFQGAPSHPWSRWLLDAVLCLDSDVVHWISPGVSVDEGWSDEATDRLLSDSRLGLVTPILVNESKPDTVLGIGWRASKRLQSKTVAAGRKVNRIRKGDLQVTGPNRLAGFCRRDLIVGLAQLDNWICLPEFHLELGLYSHCLSLENLVDLDCQMDCDVNAIRASNPRSISARQLQQIWLRFAGEMTPPPGTRKIANPTFVSTISAWLGDVLRGPAVTGVLGGFSRLIVSRKRQRGLCRANLAYLNKHRDAVHEADSLADTSPAIRRAA